MFSWMALERMTRHERPSEIVECDLTAAQFQIAAEEHRIKEHRMEEHNRHHHQKEQQKGRHKEYHREQHREQHKDQFPAFPGNSTSESRWMLDYIRVRSGCSCEMIPKPKKKKVAAIKAKKTKSKHRQPRDQEQDFETWRRHCVPMFRT